MSTQERKVMKLALEAFEGIQRYGLDTLSGRVDGPDDREWQRAGVNEMTKRARLGVTAIKEALAQSEQHSVSEQQEPVANEKNMQTELRRLRKVERKYKKALSYGTVLTFEAWGGRYKKKELEGAKYDEWLEALITPNKKSK